MTGRLLDLTLPVHAGTPAWEGSPGVRLDLRLAMARGAGSDDSFLACDCHAGTHVDAPCHRLPGAPGADALDLEVLCGPASLRDVPGRPGLDAADLAALDLPADCRRLLLRTDNTRRGLYARPFTHDYCGLTESGAAWCLERGLGLVGLDYLSVARFEESGPVHRRLLAAGVVLLEGLDLSAAPEGDHELFCLPLRLVGADGAPARCVLRLGAGPRPSMQESSEEPT
ncbi:MAG: cyclase family protein [Desulfovibrionaceae bacterium]